MRQHVISFGFAAIIAVSAGLATSAAAQNEGEEHSVQLGPRPFFLVNDMEDSRLKQELLLLGRPVQEDRLLDRPPRRGAAVPRAHAGSRTRPARAWAPASSSAT